MRICFISVGAFSHIGSYLEHFHAAGHEVHFIALSPSPPRSVPTHDLSLGGDYLPERGKWKYPLSMLRARRLVRSLRPDVVHTHYATSGGLAGLVCGYRPTVVTAHGTDLTAAMGSVIWRKLLKSVFEQAACVNTVSADLTRMAVSLGIARGKIVELTPGVDTARFVSAGKPSLGGGNELRLVCTRRFEPVYDHRTIVEALAILRTAGAKFKMTFVGDGSLRAGLEDMVARRGLRGHVTFSGPVTVAAMPAVLRANEIFLSASLGDGSSLSLLEAMSAGLLPIVSRIPANEAWLEHGAGGLLHRTGDPEDLAACVLEAARRPSIVDAAGALNRRRVVEAGDRATNMKRLEKVYESLMLMRAPRC